MQPEENHSQSPPGNCCKGSSTATFVLHLPTDAVSLTTTFFPFLNGSSHSCKLRPVCQSLSSGCLLAFSLIFQCLIPSCSLSVLYAAIYILDSKASNSFPFSPLFPYLYNGLFHGCNVTYISPFFKLPIFRETECILVPVTVF